MSVLSSRAHTLLALKTRDRVVAGTSSYYDSAIPSSSLLCADDDGVVKVTTRASVRSVVRMCFCNHDKAKTYCICVELLFNCLYFGICWL